MKTLSIRQPWAWLIVNGHKTIENRTWKTAYRGKFLVHAAQKFDLTAEEFANLREDLRDYCGIEVPAELPAGGIVGIAEIVDCVSDGGEFETQNDTDWHEPGCYGFVIRNAQPLEFEPMPGKLSFFDAHHYQIPEQ